MLWQHLFCISVLLAATNAAILKDYRFLSHNVTALLDRLLDKNRYDKRIRPGLGGPPVTVRVNMYIKSIGPVSENDESYGMDCYFRQTWFDKRLAYSFNEFNEFSLSWLILDRVWKPDTFFMNGKKSHLHRITVPNKFLRLRNDGFLTYSMRLTIKAECPMHLRKFPLDSQSCPLYISSYGYTMSDVMYEWPDMSSVAIENKELAQYSLVNVTTVNHTTFLRGEDAYSVIRVNFHMKRMQGYFMLQVYVPCGLIVCSSWISFWIDPDAVPARVSLGVTTALSMTTMGFGSKAQMPKVSYATALDSFVILCFSFVFAVMVEYAAVNFIDKVTTDLKRILQDKGIKQKTKGPSAPKPLRLTEVNSRNVSTMDLTKDDIDDIDAVSLSGQVINDTSLSLPNIPNIPNVPNLPNLPNIPSVGNGPDGTDASKASPSSLEVHPSVPIPTPVVEHRFVRTRTLSCISAEVNLNAPTPFLPLIVITDKDSSNSTSNGREFDQNTIVDFDNEHNYATVNNIDGSDGSLNDKTPTEMILACLKACGTGLLAPIRYWKAWKFLPREDDVTKQLMNEDPPDKFTNIDIQSRKFFPIAFCILLTAYFAAYTYYLTDEFPTKAMVKLNSRPNDEA